MDRQKDFLLEVKQQEAIHGKAVIPTVNLPSQPALISYGLPHANGNIGAPMALRTNTLTNTISGALKLLGNTTVVGKEHRNDQAEIEGGSDTEVLGFPA